ncbi:MAG TPA: hypothetical protein ENJ95_04235 [Bacteroidetes bacterium]|nr:hypothetical protein [Bacteroidota bacterium]
MTFKKSLTLAFLLFIFLAANAQRPINQKPIGPKIKVERFGSRVNTTAPDYAPTRYGGRVYFTSFYKKPDDGTKVARIFSFSESGKATLVNELDIKRKSAHIANPAFMPDASRMYFTICRDSKQERCEIWYRENDFNGGWGVAKRLPEIINRRGSTSTQPSIGWDEEQKKFALFFVSDREGGRGGKDIWVSHISFDGQFETPYSLPINTAMDDVTPYFDRNTQILYFSSNARGSNGDFDICKSQKTGDMWARPEGLGRPVNSAYDDLYFTLHDKSGKAYFSSNRPGSMRSAKGRNSFDIYEVEGMKAYEIVPNNGREKGAYVQSTKDM